MHLPCYDDINATIGLGVIGINPNPSRFSSHIGKVRLIGDSQEVKFSDIMLAAQSCVDAGAKVINIGFSCATVEPRDPARCYKKDWEDQFTDIYDQGVLIIGAAGNTGESSTLFNSTEYPGGYTTVMSVSAVDANGMWHDLSTRNAQVEISAPGRQVVIL
jgi:subtilisin family serine protease